MRHTQGLQSWTPAVHDTQVQNLAQTASLPSVSEGLMLCIAMILTHHSVLFNRHIQFRRQCVVSMAVTVTYTSQHFAAQTA